MELVSGLRMFVAQVPALTAGESDVFYSRRADGPFYRWRRSAPETWHVARVRERDKLSTTLSLSPWKNVPAALQKSIINHYED